MNRLAETHGREWLPGNNILQQFYGAIEFAMARGKYAAALAGGFSLKGGFQHHLAQAAETAPLHGGNLG